MKISHLKIKNIRCFKEADISFETENGEIINWSLVVGNNGDGKTTILRCLALGLCDNPALLAELYGFLRKGEKTGSVEITLKDNDTDKKYKLAMEIKGNSESVSQTIYKIDSSGKETKVKKIKEEMEIRNKIFAVGYGSGRSITGIESYEEYAVLDSVETLFNYKRRLQNAELGVRRIKDISNDQFEVLKKSLKEILMLTNDDDIILSEKGLFVKTQKWGEVSFNALSDGYQSMTTTIMDFLSLRLLYSSSDFDIKKTSGIFILDEVEQHLHPKWQRNIIRILAKQFPSMQFIGSTHTPICALGLNDLLESRTQLIKASYVNKHSEVESFDMKEEYKGYRVDQILTSSIFDLKSARSKIIEKTLEEYREIYLQDSEKRKPEDQKRMKKIEKELKDLPMWDNIRDSQQIERLTKLIEEKEKKLK